jgi:uncharacterized repeat protein (TIGR03943 family)
MNMLAAQLLFIVAALFVKLQISGLYASYVRAYMRYTFLPVAAILVILGVALLLRDRSRQRQADASHDGHPHALAVTSWLLVLPAVALFVVAPGPLRAQAALRNGISPGRSAFSPNLPTLHPNAEGIISLGVLDAAYRGTEDPTHSLREKRIHVVGFVVHEKSEQPGRFLLTRFVIHCCAADAEPYSVEVEIPQGTADPPDNTWVSAVMTWVGPQPKGAYALFDQASIADIPAPANPYDN